MEPADEKAPLEDGDTFTLTVTPADAGVRLDSFLANQIAGRSRASFQRLIDSHDVLVNGRNTKASYKVSPGDEIDVELAPPPLSNLVPEKIPVDVVYEDSQLVVVNKPAGLVVHPAAGSPSGTLANALAYHFEQLSNQAGRTRPGIVHRLDKDTSGLMVVAKSEAAHENLADQFRARTVSKNYLAMVYGRLKDAAGRIEQPLARDPRNRTRMAVVAGGRSALTMYRVRQGFQNFTLLDVDLKTGRTHQIRVHLAWLKHPVVGDEVYGGGRENSVQDPELRARIRKLKRQFLHAEALAFTHPATAERMSFQAPLPDNLTAFVSEIERREPQSS